MLGFHENAGVPSYTLHLEEAEEPPVFRSLARSTATDIVDVTEDADEAAEVALLTSIASRGPKTSKPQSRGLLSSGWATGGASSSMATPVTAPNPRHGGRDSPDSDVGFPVDFCLWSREDKRRFLDERDNKPLVPSVWRSDLRIEKRETDRSGRLHLAGAELPLTSEQRASLAKLTIPWHQNLQKLIWWLGGTPAQYTLKHHQFESALLCAGIEAPWPTRDLTDQSLGLRRLLSSSSARPNQSSVRDVLSEDDLPRDANLMRGCLLGDVMGLGKTVSAVSGLLLREFVTLLEGSYHGGGEGSSGSNESSSNRRPNSLERLSTLIVLPNTLVLEQWREHLHKANVSAKQILTYDGDFRAMRSDR